jgi:hypothetical protein
MFAFFVFRENGPITGGSSSEDLSECKISWSYVDWSKFCVHLRRYPPFWNGLSYSIQNYGVVVTFYGITSLLNFIKLYLFVQKLIVVVRQRHDNGLISLHFPFRK